MVLEAPSQPATRAPLQAPADVQQPAAPCVLVPNSHVVHDGLSQQAAAHLAAVRAPLSGWSPRHWIPEIGYV